MAFSKTPVISDEDFLKELKKLGYNDVPRDVFQLMKRDLIELLKKEKHLAENDQRGEKQNSVSVCMKCRNTEKKGSGILQRAEKLKSEPFNDADTNSDLQDASSLPQNIVEDQYRKYRNPLKGLESSFQQRQIDRMKTESDRRETGDATLSSSSARNYAYVSNNCESLPTSRNISRNVRRNLFPEILTEQSSKEIIHHHRKVSNNSPVNQANDVLDTYQDRFENLTISSFESELENDSSSLLDTKSKMTDSSLSITGNKIKRKILRHRDGKPVISEVFLDRPHIFNTSYPETKASESRAFSSAKLSRKSTNSTGSVLPSNPDAVTRSSSRHSLPTPRSLHSHSVDGRKKKNDPVTRYSYYKEYWSRFKPPGEKK